MLDRQIRVVGIDNNADYINQAQDTIRRAGLDHLISVVEMSVYELEAHLPPNEQMPTPPMMGMMITDGATRRTKDRGQ
jgi:23S rRNA G2445 N2-methylase RlmL